MGQRLSGIIWFPNTVYSDASGPQQAAGFGFDLEDNDGSDPNPGWFSEASVQSILFDIFDDSGGDEAFDEVALGLGPIYDAMVGGHRTTSALTSLFTFVSALKAASPDDAAAIDALTAHNDVTGVPSPTSTGTGETKTTAATRPTCPSIAPLTVGAGVQVTLLGEAANPNALGLNRFFRFAGDGASHTVSIATRARMTST